MSVPPCIPLGAIAKYRFRKSRVKSSRVFVSSPRSAERTSVHRRFRLSFRVISQPDVPRNSYTFAVYIRPTHQQQPSRCDETRKRRVVVGNGHTKMVVDNNQTPVFVVVSETNSRARVIHAKRPFLAFKTNGY